MELRSSSNELTYLRLCAEIGVWSADDGAEVLAEHATAESLTEVSSVTGDTVLHCVCSNRRLRAAMLDILVEEAPCAGWCATNQLGRTALHCLCANPSIFAPTRTRCRGEGSAAVEERSCFPLGSAAAAMLLSSSSAAAVDCCGWTPLHALCANMAIGTAASALDVAGSRASCGVRALRALIAAHPPAALAQAEGGASALHVLCRNRAVNAELLRAYLDAAPFSAAAVPLTRAAHAPLHWLCANEAADAAALAVLLAEVCFYVNFTVTF